MNEAFDQDYVEYDDEPEPQDRWLTTGWNKSRNKPANVCKYVKGIGLCTVFPWGNQYKLVAAGEFHGPYPTQDDAKRAARSLMR